MLTLKRVLAFTSGLAGSFLVALAPAVAQAPGSAPASAPQRGTNDAHAEAVELLRKIIKEQQQHPDRIIRTPSAAPSAAAAGSAASAAPRPDRAELERQFLDGKITAKQFQRALEDLEKNPPPPAAPAAAIAVKSPPKDPALSPRAASASPAKVITNQPVTAITTPEEAPEQKALSDVEAKIDEILSRRQAQIEAAKTNASTNAVPAGPLTKRQKLDALLSEVIQGKLTDAEYKVQREKIMAQPD